MVFAVREEGWKSGGPLAVFAALVKGGICQGLWPDLCFDSTDRQTSSWLLGCLSNGLCFIDAFRYCTNEAQGERAPRLLVHREKFRGGLVPGVSGYSFLSNLIFPLGWHHVQQALPPGGQLTTSSS